ncbi:MAG: dynamin family protein, partial [Thermoguttaceae bacterium]|nr:dynamin family protein [Thermoguttaceae bacterium]
MHPNATAILSDASPASSLPDLLQEAATRVDALGAEFESDRVRLVGLAQRLREERCYLAVLGQFKRGKSTLVNALLGEAVLPSAVVPLTSIPTFLQDGRQLGARVLFDDGKAEERFVAPDARALAEFLARFVTESANPRNRLGVRQVEATYPAPVLEKGVALIDTPGIGSTFRHNTEATINFLPQCDAAIFVVSADPPVTEVEVEFLKLARRKLARLFFVLNKVDYLDAEERRAAVAFLQKVLCEQVGFAAPPPVYCVSARQGLAARRNRDAAAWRDSGMAEIEHRIVDFLLTEKMEVLESAVSRQTSDVLADVERRLRLTQRSLEMPLDELDERIRLFEESLARIEEQRIVLMNRLSAEEERLAGWVTDHADALLPESLKYLDGVVRACQDQQGAKWSEEPTREAIAAAIPGFFERAFGETHQRCEQRLREALAPYRRRASELIASVHGLVERLFHVPYEPRRDEITLVKAELPYWRTCQFRFTSIGSIPDTWIDRLFPQRFRHARIRRRLMEQVEYLVSRNIGDLRSSTLENLKRSVQGFREWISDGIQRSMQTTRAAIDAARRRRIEDSATVAPELARLGSAIAELRALRAR